jgi:8-oxo-dGTP pyrophosphatase MutT (NUDIX family)
MQKEALRTFRHSRNFRGFHRAPICISKMEETFISTVKEFLQKYRHTQIRCGMIPYLHVNGRLHLCFGKDRRTGDLTDFGGGKMVSETIVQAALREGYEESRCVFQQAKLEDIMSSTCLFNRRMFIILIDSQLFFPALSPTEILEKSCEFFDEETFLSSQHASKKQYMEMESIIWIPEDLLKTTLIDNGYQVKFYTVVRKFIKSCPSFTQSIENMKQYLNRPAEVSVCPQ